MACSIALDFSSFGTIPPSSKRTPTGQLTSAMWIWPSRWWRIFNGLLLFDIKYYIFAGLMKRYKVRQIIRFLERDGWALRNCKGDHRQYVHPEKSGKVTVRGKLSDNLDQFLLNSIWKQAGWKWYWRSYGKGKDKSGLVRQEFCCMSREWKYSMCRHS